MFNIFLSAIAAFFAYVCYVETPEESIKYISTAGWVFVSGYFFICEIVKQIILENE